MRKETTKYGTSHFLYKSDLVEFDTRMLLRILHSCRAYISKWKIAEEKSESVWCEYAWDSDNQREWYTMIWMVKDVLATREHIPTKQERRKIRQEKAKVARNNR